jgi:hypothetical protein
MGHLSTPQKINPWRLTTSHQGLVSPEVGVEIGSSEEVVRNPAVASDAPLCGTGLPGEEHQAFVTIHARKMILQFRAMY